MPHSKTRRKKSPQRFLALPDLEHAKTAVLNNFTSASRQRTYDHAIREFVGWYCSEPALRLTARCPPRPHSPGAAPLRARHDQSAPRCANSNVGEARP